MDDFLDDRAPAPRVRRWLFSPVLIVSVAVHLLFAGGAGYYVVSRYSTARKLTFQGGPKSPNPAERALQHRVQMQQKTQNALTAVPKRVLTTGLAKIALPDMPSLPGPKNAAQPAMMAAGGQSSGFGGSPGGMGSAGGTGSGAAINFFGIRDTSSSVVIMIDVSLSMFSRTGDAEGSKLAKLGKEQSFQTVRDEAIKLVQGLTPNTRFGVVRWAAGAYSWQAELVPATEENKQAAIAHIQTDVDLNKAPKKGDRPGGTRHDYALEETFTLKPEVIFMLTDGNATAAREGPIPEQEIYNAAENGQKTLSKRARLHAIYYVTGEDKPDERKMLSGLAGRNGGKFQQVIAKGRTESAPDDLKKKRRR